MLRSILIRPPSARDRRVHLVVGCLMPLLFIVVDPAVFRAGTILPFGGAYLGAYRAFVYAATALAALLLVRALNVSRASELEAGMLYGATGVAFLLGVVLLPLSIAGILFFGLGLLGLCEPCAGCTTPMAWRGNTSRRSLLRRSVNSLWPSR
jgi:hypothetical protein